jgi:hypothetical protein
MVRPPIGPSAEGSEETGAEEGPVRDLEPIPRGRAPAAPSPAPDRLVAPAAFVGERPAAAPLAPTAALVALVGWFFAGRRAGAGGVGAGAARPSVVDGGSGLPDESFIAPIVSAGWGNGKRPVAEHLVNEARPAVLTLDQADHRSSAGSAAASIPAYVNRARRNSRFGHHGLGYR